MGNAQIGELANPQLLGSANSKLFLRTFPFAHMLLSASRGTHHALQVGFPFMKLIQELQASIDSDLLRTNASESYDAANRSLSRRSSEATISPDWGTALDEDPIES